MTTRRNIMMGAAAIALLGSGGAEAYRVTGGFSGAIGQASNPAILIGGLRPVAKMNWSPG